jgi:nucleotide-binding universal stress UspA family protein
MAESEDRGTILVGIAPSGEHQAALEYAADQALRRGCDIRLLVVLAPPVTHALVEPERLVDELAELDETLLDTCRKRLWDWTGDRVSVTTDVARGPVLSTLLEASEGSHLVVLQHHRMARRFHVPTLSVTNGVASRATVPVVAVPDGWHARDTRPGPVLAAVEHLVEGFGVVEAAFALARVARTGVRIVHAWSTVDVDLPEASGPDRVAATIEAQIADGVSGLADAYPDVMVEVVAAHGQPAFVIVNAATEARQVVIGRHDPALPWGSHLGPVTRAVLTHADCPVVVVDPSAQSS